MGLPGAALLVFVIERRFRPRPPGLFAAYITLYCVGRFVDRAAPRRPGARDRRPALNAWVSLGGIVAGALWFWPLAAARRAAGARPAKPAADQMTVPRGRVRPGG